MLMAGGTIAGALVGLYTAFVTLAVPFLNSDLSPVVGAQRYAFDRKEQKTTAEVLDKTVEALGKIGQSVDAMLRRQDAQDCEDWNRRLRTYSETLRVNPRDENARTLHGIAERTIRGLAGCVQESQ